MDRDETLAKVVEVGDAKQMEALMKQMPPEVLVALFKEAFLRLARHIAEKGDQESTALMALCVMIMTSGGDATTLAMSGTDVPTWPM